MIRFISAALLAAAALVAALPVLAQKTAAEIPVEAFFKRPEVSTMTLSPDGKRIAFIASFKGRDNLMVMDIEKKAKTALTSFETYDVVNFNWISNTRLFFRVADVRDVLNNIRYIGTYAIDADGENLKNLADAFGGRQVGGSRTGISPLAALTDGSDDFIVLMNSPRTDAADVHVLDTKTGRSKRRLTVDSPADTNNFILDWNNVPRVAFSLDPRKAIYTVWYRDGYESPWTELMSYPDGRAVETIQPLRFNADNQTLFVASNIGRDKAAIYTYDPKAKKLGDLVLEHPMIDLWGGPLFDFKTHKLVGVGFVADKPVNIWIDPDLRRLQAQVDAALPGKTNAIIRPRESYERVIVHSYSDTDPGRYYLLTRNPLRMEELLATRPAIKPELMSPTTYMPYKARDGLEIPAWVTIPKASSGKNLPLVVNIHGGPWLRIYGYSQWDRNEGQFFASRGYVVLEAEPRASDGFGRKHLSAGFKQWGQTMQDDITDGVLALIKAGIVDKNRVCLYGGSYGGYATLMGLIKEPDMFRCGVPFVAVTNIHEFVTSNEADYSKTLMNFDVALRNEVGDPGKDRAMMDKYSPYLHAKAIKVPVLLAMGQVDQRVPLVQGKVMRDALQEAGVKHEYIVYPGEGHGWNKEENLFDWYKRVEKFLGENLK